MPSQVNASHILLKTEQDANVALYDVTHGKRFEDVAMEKSLCPSRKKGGNLGWCQKPPVRDWWHAAYRKCDGWFLSTLKIPLNLVCDNKPLVK